MRFVQDDAAALDAIDRQILDRLKLNGRESAASIAKAVSLSAPAVQRRIDKLEARGVIRGYTVAVSYDRIESSVDAYVAVNFKPDTDVYAALGELIELPEVREAVMLAGEPDAILRVRLSSQAALGALAMRVRRRDDVSGTRTHVAVGRWWHGAARKRSDVKPPP